MKFENRQTQFPGRKRVRKLNANNEQMEEYFVVMENAEGNVMSPGTPVNSENLEKANWRDDTNISFKTLAEGENEPIPQPNITQIYTKTNGETWIVPSAESGAQPKVITEPAGTVITVNGGRPPTLEFDEHPQVQLDKKVTVKGRKINAEFIEHPQVQLTMNRNAIASLSTDFGNHTDNLNNPHAVTKEQVGLGNADNTSDADKPISAAQQSALNKKLDLQTAKNTVYAIGELNNNFQQPVDGNAGGNTIPIRRSNGAVATALTPSADDEAASKAYVDGRSLRRIWRYNVEGKGQALDIGPEVNIPKPSGISEGDLFYMHVHRGGMRQMYTGVWSEGTMQMILPGDAMVNLNDISYLHRIRMWVANDRLYIRSEVAMVSSVGNTNWRLESGGIFYMLFLIVNKAVN